MTAIEIVKSFKGCNNYNLCSDCPIKTGLKEQDKTDYDCSDFMMKVTKEALEELSQDSKLQEQYVKRLEQDKENMKKIINILCDTISQLI